MGTGTNIARHVTYEQSCAVGIYRPTDWPYGPNLETNIDMRVGLVDWASRHRFKLSSKGRSVCPHWLIGKQCWSALGTRNELNCELGYGGPMRRCWDHVSGWTLARKAAAITMQPYNINDVDWSFFKGMCFALGLTLHVNEELGWYGRSTHFIVITSALGESGFDADPIN